MIMHIRYKQSCLIILRHISDRVINKHCKINEEKCDLQFPLIGKALAFLRHKVIALGPEEREGQGQGLCPFGVPAPPTPSSVRAQLCPGLLPPASALGGWRAGLTGGRAENTSGLMAPGLAPLV